MKHIFLIALTNIITFVVQCQTDFNHYRTILSQGAIPADFTTLTSEKIKNDNEKRDGLSNKEQELFLEGIHYGIDNILQSNRVLYGDPISVYVKEIAQKLLVNDPELFNQLRFYTIKSNQTNALSTDQGIIFVTTGLISQLENEAQLAYVLAHEITHFKRKHVVETYEWKNTNFSKNYTNLTQYSKDKEFEADQYGVALYQAAGYSKDEINTTFDVLMYSYLPFEEIPFDKTYFNKNSFYVPPSIFPTEPFKIKAEEDFNDALSSHPNIKKRKAGVKDDIEALSEWGNLTNQLGETRFFELRNIARFETVRTDLLNAEYSSALYSIYALEKEFPQSYFLRQMKAQCWLGYALYKGKGNSSVFSASILKEGEIGNLHHFIRKLDKTALLSLSLRNLYDLYKEDTANAAMKIMFQRVVEVIANQKQFKLEDFKSTTFQEESSKSIKKESVAEVPVSNPSDTVKNIRSKYDRIKTKKKEEIANSFDSTKFYLYGMSDIFADTVFKQLYAKYHKKEDVLEDDLNAAFSDLSDELGGEFNVVFETLFNVSKGTNFDSVIVMQPRFYDYNKKGIDRLSSERKTQLFNDIIEESCEQQNINATFINRESLIENGSKEFNNRNLILTMIEQVEDNRYIHAFPVDYDLIEELRSEYQKDKVAFFVFEHEKDADISVLTSLSFLMVGPFAPLGWMSYFPIKIYNGQNTSVRMIVLDLKDAKIAINSYQNFHLKPTKLNFDAVMQEIIASKKIAQ